LLAIVAVAVVIGIFSAKAFKPPTYIRKGGSKHITMDHVFNGTFAVRYAEIMRLLRRSWII